MEILTALTALHLGTAQRYTDELRTLAAALGLSKEFEQEKKTRAFKR